MNVGRRSFGLIVWIALGLLTTGAANAAVGHALDAKIASVATDYRRGEPIALVVEFTNVSSAEIEIFRRDELGFSTTRCDDVGALATREPPNYVSGRIGDTPTRLRPGERVRGWVIVSEDLTFTTPKRYTLRLQVSYRLLGVAGIESWDYQTFAHSIVVAEGAPRASAIDSYLRDAGESRFAFEMLLWSIDPRATDRVIETMDRYRDVGSKVFLAFGLRLPDERATIAIQKAAEGKIDPGATPRPTGPCCSR